MAIRKLLLALALVLGLAPAGARAQMVETIVNDTHQSGAAPAWQGLGSLGLGPAYDYQSCGRAYNLAWATSPGTACDVVRASDSTSCTIKFAATGFADQTTAYCNSNTQTIAQFCNATTCKISKAYDGSGASNCSGPCDAVQATDLNRPALAFNCFGSGLLCMQFSGSQCLISANISVPQAQPVTVVTMAERTGSFTSQSQLVTANAGSFNLNFASSANSVNSFAGTSQTKGSVADSVVHAIQWVANAASSAFYTDGTNTAISSGTNGINSGNDITLGCQDGALNELIGFIAEVAIYPAGFGSTQLAAADQNLRGSCGYNLIAGGCGSIAGLTKSIVTEGDSLTSGVVSGTLINGYPTVYVGLGLPGGYQLFNTALSGSTLASVAARAANDSGGYATGAKNVCTLLIGANDLATYPGATDAIAAASYSTAIFSLASTWKANGCTKVGIGTILSTAVTAENTRRNIVNPVLRTAVGSQIDFVIDFAADATLGTDTSCAVTPAAWAQSGADCTHPSQTSQTNIMEPLFATAVNAQ